MKPKTSSALIHFFCFTLLSACLILYWQILDDRLFFDSVRAFDEFFGIARKYNTLWSFLSSIPNMDRRFTYLTFVVVHKIFHNLSGQYLFNIIIHYLNSCLVFVLINKLYKNRQTSFWISLFFAVNPLAIYAIAYLVQRNILLTVFFGLGQCIFFLNALESRTNQKTIFFFILSILSFLLAKISKEQGVLLILSYPLLSCIQGLTFKTIVLNGVILFIGMPFILNTDIHNLLLYKFEDKISVAQFIQKACNIPAENLRAKSFATQSWLFFKYFFYWLIPFETSIDMRVQLKEKFYYVIPLFGLIVTSLYFIKKRKGVLLCVGILISISLFISELVVNRIGDIFVLYRSYLWMIGYIIVVGWVVNLLVRTISFRKTLSICFALIVLIMGYKTSNNLKAFGNHIEVWKQAEKLLTPETMCQSSRIYNNIATNFLREKRFKESIYYLKKGLMIFPDYPFSILNLGNTYLLTGKIDLAETLYKRVIAKKFDRIFLTGAYAGLGNIERRRGNTDGAIFYFEEARQANIGSILEDEIDGILKTLRERQKNEIIDFPNSIIFDS